MLADKKQKLKSCRTKLKEKLKGRLNAPVPLRGPLQSSRENSPQGDSFFENFHANYQICSINVLNNEPRNIKHRQDRELEQDQNQRQQQAAPTSRPPTTNQTICGRRSTPRQNLTDRLEHGTSRGTSRTNSKNRSSSKLIGDKSITRYKRIGPFRY